MAQISYYRTQDMNLTFGVQNPKLWDGPKEQSAERKHSYQECWHWALELPC